MKLKILLSVYLPVLIIFPLACWFFAWSQLKEERTNQINECRNEIHEMGYSLVQNANLVIKNVNIFSSFLTTKRDIDLISLFEQSLEEIPSVEAFVVAYDPAFLELVAQGQHPDCTLLWDKHLPKLDGVPKRYAPIVYRDEKKKIHIANNANDAYDSRDYFLVPKLSLRGTWVYPFLEVHTKQRLIAYGLPFYHDGFLAGVIVCMLKVEDLFDSEQLQRFVSGRSNTNRLFIVNQAGQVIFHTDSASWPAFSLYAMATEAGKEEDYDVVDHMLNVPSGYIESNYLGADEKRFGKARMLYVFDKARFNTSWTMVGAFPVDRLLGPARHNIHVTIVAAFLVLIVISGIVVVLLLRSSSPIEAMTRVAKQVAVGNLDATVPDQFLQRRGSVGELVRSYNKMILNLKQLIDQEVQENLKRTHFEQEFLIGEDLQKTFLPDSRVRFFPDRGYAISGDLIPAKYVAGDFFDFWRVNSDLVGIVIGDVSGKGIAASMVMVATSTLIRQAATKYANPGDVVSEVNQILLKRNKKNMFVTLFLAFYDPVTGVIQYCNAGHNQPIIFNESGKVTFFPYAENCVIGVMPDMKYQTAQTKLEEGETLFLYNDGVTDATAPDSEQFGKNRLKKLLSYLSKTPPEKFVDYVERALKNFQGEVPTDDMTMLMLTRINDTSQCWTTTVAIETVYGKETPVIESILQELRAQKWSDRDLFSIEIALNEGIHNAMEHGNQLDPKKKVHVSCCLSGRTFSVTIRDEGIGFIEGLVPDPREDDRITIPTGRGILLIRGFMTRVWFNDACNEIYMTKDRSDEGT